MQRHNVVTDDLSSAISPHVAEFRRPNDVHFTAKGSEFLGIQVARFLEKQIKR
jgi:hypothetical protein